MLELGSSLGISTAYQAFAAPDAQFISIEGCAETAAVAKQNLTTLGIHHVDLQLGTFKSLLPSAAKRLGKLDYLYIDGDHRYKTSLDYFNTCLPYAHHQSVFVIADIYWSTDMETAWNKMCAHPSVSLSIDYYHFGLLFFRQENKTRQHFTLIPSRYKPWRMGFISSQKHLSQ
jgi:predicted O-methyltransferase YrrM